MPSGDKRKGEFQSTVTDRAQNRVEREGHNQWQHANECSHETTCADCDHGAASGRSCARPWV
jgi:hypothetical protein